MNKILPFLMIWAGLACTAFGAATISTMDNVENYSSSPFWSINGPYNQKFPTPVYVKGPSLTAAECQTAVNSAIWTQCSFMNNCVGLTIEDIRPGVIMELTTKTDGNYATSCAAYIDSAFDLYQQRIGGTVMPSDFPVAGYKPGTNVQNSPRANPFSYGNQVPDYEFEQDLRQAELQAMQRQTAQIPGLTATDMPTTFEDLDFATRMNVINEGFQHPAVGKVPMYAQLNLESDLAMYNRRIEEAKAKTDAINERKAELKAQDIWLFCNDELNYYDPDCKEFFMAADFDGKFKDLYPHDWSVEEFERKKALAKASLPVTEFCESYPGDDECKTRTEQMRQERKMNEERNRQEQQITNERQAQADERDKRMQAINDAFNKALSGFN